MRKFITRNDCVLGVSGGADSMFLLHNFKNTINLHVVHVNYNIREDSNKDALLIKRYCNEHNIPCHIKIIEKPPIRNVEAWARDVRYDFYREIKQKYNLKYIVTAHNANDQVETLYIRLYRGTSFRGLACIYGDSGELYRPLLNWKKESIYDECDRLNIPFNEDSTNTDVKYLRNWFRKNIDTNSEVDLVGSICNKVQMLIPKVADMATHIFSNDVFEVDGNIHITKSIEPDHMLHIHLNNILGDRLSLTDKVFNTIFSDDHNTRYFDIKRNVKCNKRKRDWIILEFS